MRKPHDQKTFACLAHGARDFAALRAALKPIIEARRPRWVECRECHELCHPDDFSDVIYRGLCTFCGPAKLEALFRAFATAPLLSRERQRALLAIKRFASR